MGIKTTQGGPPQNVKFSDNRKSRTYQDSDPDRIILAQEEKRASTWSAIFLPSTGVLLLAVGILLVVLGSIRDQADLIVLGVIFMAGSVVFFILMYTAVCRPLCHRNQVDHFSYIDTVQPTDSPAATRPMSEPPAYSPREHYKSPDLKSAKFQLVPRESVLYANDRSRSFLATPATTKDVNFDEGLETPPPPRIALPHGIDGDIGDVKGFKDNMSYEFDDYDLPPPPVFKTTDGAPEPAVYEADIEKVKQNKDITALELL